MRQLTWFARVGLFLLVGVIGCGKKDPPPSAEPEPPKLPEPVTKATFDKIQVGMKRAEVEEMLGEGKENVILEVWLLSEEERKQLPRNTIWRQWGQVKGPLIAVGFADGKVVAKKAHGL